MKKSEYDEILRDARCDYYIAVGYTQALIDHSIIGGALKAAIDRQQKLFKLVLNAIHNRVDKDGL